MKGFIVEHVWSSTPEFEELIDKYYNLGYKIETATFDTDASPMVKGVIVFAKIGGIFG